MQWSCWNCNAIAKTKILAPYQRSIFSPGLQLFSTICVHGFASRLCWMTCLAVYYVSSYDPEIFWQWMGSCIFCHVEEFITTCQIHEFMANWTLYVANIDSARFHVIIGCWPLWQPDTSWALKSKNPCSDSQFRRAKHFRTGRDAVRSWRSRNECGGKSVVDAKAQECWFDKDETWVRRSARSEESASRHQSKRYFRAIGLTCKSEAPERHQLLCTNFLCRKIEGPRRARGRQKKWMIRIQSLKKSMIRIVAFKHSIVHYFEWAVRSVEWTGAERWLHHQSFGSWRVLHRRPAQTRVRDWFPVGCGLNRGVEVWHATQFAGSSLTLSIFD
jgi:hypothetical protein